MDYPITIHLPESSEVQRIDLFLAAYLNQPRAVVQKTIEAGLVTRNNVVAKKNNRVRAGDVVIIEKNTHSAPTAIVLPDLNIISETPEVIVVYKQPGIVVHPDTAHPVGSTLADAVAHQFPEIANVGEIPGRPGLVHRLDKPVSGVVLFARTQEVHTHLKNQFINHEINKKYIAFVHGSFDSDDITIDYSITRKKSGFMAAQTNKQSGREALTHLSVLEKFHHSTLVELRPKTGRTHQLRVHLFAHGNPIVGDEVYMNKKFKNSKLNKLFDRLFLHANTIGYKNLSGEYHEFTAPIPKVFSEFKNTLKPIK